MRGSESRIALTLAFIPVPVDAVAIFRVVEAASSPDLLSRHATRPGHRGLSAPGTLHRNIRLNSENDLQRR